MAIANEMATALGAARVAVGLEARGAAAVRLSRSPTPPGSAATRRWSPPSSRRWTRPPTARDHPPARGAEDAVANPGRARSAGRGLGSAWGLHHLPPGTEHGTAGAITLAARRGRLAETVVRLGEAIASLIGPILEHKRRARRSSPAASSMPRGTAGAAARAAAPGLEARRPGGGGGAGGGGPDHGDFRVAGRAVLEGRGAARRRRALRRLHRDRAGARRRHRPGRRRAGDARRQRPPAGAVRWRRSTSACGKLSAAMAKRDPGTATSSRRRSPGRGAARAGARRARPHPHPRAARRRLVAGDSRSAIGAPSSAARCCSRSPRSTPIASSWRSTRRHPRHRARPAGQAGAAWLPSARCPTASSASPRSPSGARAATTSASRRHGAPPRLRPGMEGVAKISAGGLLDRADLDAPAGRLAAHRGLALDALRRQRKILLGQSGTGWPA